MAKKTEHPRCPWCGGEGAVEDGYCYILEDAPYWAKVGCNNSMCPVMPWTYEKHYAPTRAAAIRAAWRVWDARAV